MKKIARFAASLVALCLIFMPAMAQAGGHGGGGAVIGFGVGLLSGILLAPRPVYVAAPVYTPPVVVATPPAYYIQPSAPPASAAPVAPAPPAAAAPPAPGTESKCREWKLIERHYEDRWDSSVGRWQSVPVEKWGWVDVPCDSGMVQGSITPPAPPQYALPAPPEVAVIPGTYVYMVPGISVDLLFYQGYWYRPYRGYWYRAVSYNGPWVFIGVGAVPAPILHLPPDYHRLPPHYHHIAYAHLQANWARWEREHYWHNDRDWREGRGRH